MATESWRGELKRATVALEAHLHRGLPDRAAEDWVDDLEGRLRAVSAALVGLGHEIDSRVYPQVVEQAPRLAPALGKLRRRHFDLEREVTDRLDQVTTAARADDVVDLRDAIGDVLLRIGSHDHQVVSVLFDAHVVDLGGPG